MPASRLRANALLLLAALIWGSAFVGQSVGMASIGPLAFTGLRFLLGAAVVAPFAWREWQQLAAAGHAPGRREARWVLLLGALLCLGVVLQQIGIVSTSVTNAGFLTALYVPLVPLLLQLAATATHSAPARALATKAREEITTSLRLRVFMLSKYSDGNNASHRDVSGLP